MLLTSFQKLTEEIEVFIEVSFCRHKVFILLTFF